MRISFLLNLVQMGLRAAAHLVLGLVGMHFPPPPRAVGVHGLLIGTDVLRNSCSMPGWLAPEIMVTN